MTQTHFGFETVNESDKARRVRGEVVHTDINEAMLRTPPAGITPDDFNDVAIHGRLDRSLGTRLARDWAGNSFGNLFLTQALASTRPPGLT